MPDSAREPKAASEHVANRSLAASGSPPKHGMTIGEDGGPGSWVAHYGTEPDMSYRRSPEELAALRAQAAEANEKADGLRRKYHVERLNDPNGKHADCRYFVLDPQHDPLAREALEAYSDAAFSAGYIALSKEIDHWIGRETVPAREPNPNHSGSPFLPCKPCDELLPGRGGKPGGVGGCIGAEPTQRPLGEPVITGGSEASVND